MIDVMIRAKGTCSPVAAVLLVAFLALMVPSATAQPVCSVEEVSIRELLAALDTGACTTRSISEAYLARIDSLDRNGPMLRSIVEVNPDALAIADSLDRERARGNLLGPLHGIPIVLKDNIATADRMTTTAGSLVLEGSIAPEDAGLVERLRNAGALILAKTNLSEWANFRSTSSSSGWSGRGGQVRNPYVLDRSPCGSSSGTGTAVAASLAAAGVGTETDGSIVCPSHATSLVGIKATVGLISRFGIIPISESQDTAGPMARSVEDAALLLSAMVGVDRRDSATVESEGHVHADYTQFLDPDALEGARIGVLRIGEFFGYSKHADRLTNAAIRDMRASGAIILDSLELASTSEYDEDEFTVLLYEFKHGLNAYLDWLGADAPVKSLAEIIAYNEAHPDPHFGQELFEMAQAKGELTDESYRNARARGQRIARASIDSLLEAHDLDALVAPTGGPAWPIDHVNCDHFLGASSTPAAVAGYPIVTVPAGYAFELPVGISFIGTAWSEPALIRLAYAFEQATRHRRPPTYLDTLELK